MELNLRIHYLRQGWGENRLLSPLVSTFLHNLTPRASRAANLQSVPWWEHSRERGYQEAPAIGRQMNDEGRLMRVRSRLGVLVTRPRTGVVRAKTRR